MKIYTQKSDIRPDEAYVGSRIDVKNSIFFDIETTGFSPASSRLYMIGCLYYDSGSFFIKQFFLDDTNDEEILIRSFLEFVSGYGCLVHFNGTGFDIPYITEKCRHFGIPLPAGIFAGVDIYKETLMLKNILCLENHKQKSLEKFFGIKRDDKYSGGELINVYKAYLCDRDNIKLSLLLLHNMEDIKNMPCLLKLFHYTSFFTGGYEIASISPDPHGREFQIRLNLNFPLEVPVTCASDSCRLNAFEHSAKITVKIYSDELKYFYPDYKNYYYLPGENIAIHKSVAFYVDKNYRTRAKAADCYSRKSGRFLPQYENIISPYFKRDYDDKITYFEMTEDFLDNGESVRNYIDHILIVLCKKLPV